jgi:hypothetical protein
MSKPTTDLDFNAAPVAAKSDKTKENLPKIILQKFPCKVTGTAVKGKTIEIKLTLDDFEISEELIKKVFGKVNKQGAVENSTLAIFGYLQKEEYTLVLEGETVELFDKTTEENNE